MDESQEEPIASRLTSEQLAALAAELQDSRYSGKTPDEIVAILHAKPEIRTPQPPKLAELTLIAVLSILSDASATNLSKLPLFTDVRDKIKQQDREGVGMYALFLAKAGAITAEEAISIGQLLAETVEQPEVVTVGKSRFELALKFVPGFPNKVRVIDVETALASEVI